MKLLFLPDLPVRLLDAQAECQGLTQEMVALADLHLRQRRLRVESLALWMSWPGPFPSIEVTPWNGGYLVLDGNHRAWIAHIRGEEKIAAVIRRPLQRAEQD